jgi:hypothetical protein
MGEEGADEIVVTELAVRVGVERLPAARVGLRDDSKGVVFWIEADSVEWHQIAAFARINHEIAEATSPRLDNQAVQFPELAVSSGFDTQAGQARSVALHVSRIHVFEVSGFRHLSLLPST